MELFYSTGQVAEALGTSQENIRRLCQAGAIRAELTSGGQHRVPQAEYERLMRDGLPTTPRPLPGDRGKPLVAGTGTIPPGLLAQPSEALVESAEQVAKLSYQAKSLRLQRRIDTEHDYSRKRESRIEQEQRELEEAAQARQDALEAGRRRAEWIRGWEEYALRCLPYGATPETRLDVHQQVRAQLSGLDPLPSDVTVQSLTQAIIDRALHVAKCRQQSLDIIDRLMRDLPYGIQHGSAFALERGAALTLMTEAVERLPVEADEKLKEATARLAVEPILKRYHQYQACQALLQSLPGMMPRANQAEKEAAWRSLVAALEKLPVGTSQTKLEEERDRVVAAVMEGVEKREEGERHQAEEKQRQREEAGRRAAAEYKVASAIIHVDVVLKELEEEGAVEFDGFSDQWDTARRMRETVSPLLVEELVREPEMTREQVKRKIGVLVRRNLDVVVPD
jgi:excisionase family DNA binding protein